MRKHYPLNSQGAEDAGKLPWIDGVPSTGVEGSYPGQALFTDTEAEILAAIDGGGFVRSGSDLTQLLQTISRGLWLGVFGGSGTALTATLPNSLVLPSLQAGMRVRGIAASNFTGSGGTLAITGVGAAGNTVSYPLVGSDGVTALASGAWVAGQFLTFEIDASGNARFGGGGGPGVSSATINGIVSAAPVNALVIPSPYPPGTAPTGTQGTNVPSGAATKLTVFNPATNNISNRLTWNTSTSRVSVLISGWYYVQMYLDVNLQPASYLCSLAMNKNGLANSSVYFNVPAISGSLGPAFSAQRLVYLTAGDYCEFFFTQAYGSAQYVPVSVLIEARGV